MPKKEWEIYTKQNSISNGVGHPVITRHLAMHREVFAETGFFPVFLVKQAIREWCEDIFISPVQWVEITLSDIFLIIYLIWLKDTIFTFKL